MLDIKKDWGYRKEDIQHVADTYGISYAKAEESLNFNINKRDKLGDEKAFPVDEYWKEVKEGATPERAYASSVAKVGLPSRVVADVPLEKVVRKDKDKGIKPELKGAYTGLAVFMLVVIALWYFLLGRIRRR